MNKSNFFSGQPIFSQLLRLIPKDSLLRIAYDSRSDHYCKRFNTYEHLVTMLYSIFNNCNSIREVTTGMLASEQRLAHLGISIIHDEVQFQMPIFVGRPKYLKRFISASIKKYVSFLSDS